MSRLHTQENFEEEIRRSLIVALFQVKGIIRERFVLPRCVEVYINERDVMKHVMRNFPEVKIVLGKPVFKVYPRGDYDEGLLDFISPANLVYRRRELEDFKSQVLHLEGKHNVAVTRDLSQIGEVLLIRDFLLIEALQLPEEKLERLVNAWINKEPYVSDHCKDFGRSIEEIKLSSTSEYDARKKRAQENQDLRKRQIRLIQKLQ